MQRNSSMPTKRKLINPASMTKAESIFAGLVLDYYVRGNYTSFTPKQLLQVDQSLYSDDLPDDVKDLFNTYSIIQFSQELNAAKSARSVTGVCYYLLDYGRKNFHNSMFRNVAGVLQPQPDGSLTFKSEKCRLAKCWRAEKKEAEQENELTRRHPLISAKPLSALKDSPTGKELEFNVMVMRQLPGVDLMQYMLQERQGKLVFTLEQRLLLSRQLMRALIEQVQMKNIIHRDISTHNIRVDMSKPDLPVIIFDFGTSVDKDVLQHNATLYGTPIYMSPEVYDMKEAKFPADVYSMAWVLASLWHADRHPVETMQRKYGKKHLKTYEIYQVQMAMNDCLINTAHDCHLKNFFKGITGLSAEHKKRIADTIQLMVNPVPENRVMAEDVLKCFDDVLSERRIHKLPKELSASATHAHYQGQALRYSLQMLEWQYDGVAMLREIAESVTQALDSITDQSEVIYEFVDAAGLYFLKDLTTKEAITLKLDSMQQQFSHLYHAFAEIKEKSAELPSRMNDSWPATQRNQVKSIANRVALVDRKYAEPKNLQELLAAIPKLDKYVNKLTLEIDQLCSMNVTGPSLQSPTCM